MSPPQRVELAPGYAVPRLIVGCWQLAAGHRERGVEPGRAVAGLRRLAEAGFDAFDVADIYTGAEELLGRLAAECRRAGGPRIRVHTKLVPDLADLGRVGRRHVEAVVDRSLARLGVERLDLVQLHWWDYAVPGWIEAAGHLADLVGAGKVRLVGATNFDAPRLAEMLDAGLPLASLQVQYSLLDRRPAAELAGLARRRGVALLAYGALAGGFLAGGWTGRPAPEEPLADRSKVKYRLIVEELGGADGGWRRLQRVLAALDGVADRHAVKPADVALRWVLDRPGVSAAIVGARDDRHLDGLERVGSLALDDADRELLEEAVAGCRGPRGPVYGLERDRSGRHGAIMRYDLNRIDGRGGSAARSTP